MNPASHGKRAVLIVSTTVLGAAAAAALLLVRRRRSKSDEGKAPRPRFPPSFISTELIETHLVKADPNAIPISNSNDGQPTQESREKMSEVDEWLTKSSHWLGFCYRFDAILDGEKVRAGLERTLAHIPSLGARVDTGSDPTSYEFVLTPEVSGVVLEIARGHLVDPNSGVQLPDETCTRKEWQMAGLDAPPPGFEGEPGPNDPLMRARLTVFESQQVSYLAIGVSHGLGDGHSITDVLQTWSHFCTSASADGLPENLRRRREFGMRVVKPARPAKGYSDLQERLKDDVGCDVDPLSRWAFYWPVLPRAIVCMSRQRVVEVRVGKERMVALKAAVMEALPKGDWISTFELMCAAIFVAQRATVSAGPMPADHIIHVGTNLRGRAERFASDYFGNASFDFRKSLQLPEDTSWTLRDVVAVAQEVHTAIRSGLADPEKITKTKDWFEAARHMGYRNTYDIWPIIFDILKGTGTFVNSWDSRWLQISMGAKEQARAFHAYFGIMQNIIVEVPCDRKSGDSTIHLALPSGHSERFVAFCQACGADSGLLPFPFSIVQYQL